jgi:hypothetical protein
MPAHPATVAICNRALGLIEHNVRFSDFEDGSDEAEEAKLHYDAARRLVLSRIPWHFATDFVLLSATLDASSAGNAPAAMPNVFLLPPGVIKLRRLPDAPEGARWRVVKGDNRLYTDQGPPLLIEATFDAQDPMQFEPDFVAALEALLAAKFAPRFSRSQNRTEVWLRRFEELMAEAAGSDAQEGEAPPWDGRLEPDWRGVVENAYSAGAGRWPGDGWGKAT